MIIRNFRLFSVSLGGLGNQLALYPHPPQGSWLSYLLHICYEELGYLVWGVEPLLLLMTKQPNLELF